LGWTPAKSNGTLSGSRGGVLELEKQEVVNNTRNKDKGAAELQPPGPKSSDVQDFFDLGQESEEDEAGEVTLGVLSFPRWTMMIENLQEEGL
jgi:hypothetical protein